MISVFFSSTFSDMQQERNLIQKYVFPEAQLYAEKNGETLNFVDLRWGIDTAQMNAQEAMSKIMTVCKDKILDCFPCFIALLGGKYGSEVSRDDYPCDGLTKGKTIGITEYEIVTRLNMGIEGVSFFVRNDVQQFQPRAMELRQSIQERFPKSVYSYELRDHQTVQTFIKQMIQVICLYIDEKIRNEPTSLRYMHYIRSHSTGLINREKYEARITKVMQDGNPFVLLTGLEGIGKKSILYSFLAGRSCRVIGIHPVSDTKQPDLESLCEDLLGQLTHLPETDFSLKSQERSSADKLREALLIYNKTCADDLFIVIEDIEKQLGPDWPRELLQLPTGSWRNIHWCGTAAFLDSQDEIVMDLADIVQIPVDYLDIVEKEKMATRMFCSRDKELAVSTMNVLCNRQLSGYPFYLNVVLQSMLLLDEADISELYQQAGSKESAGDRIAVALTAFVRSIPDDLHEMLQFIFRWFLAKTDKDLSGRILSLISHTRFGLREKDLKVVLEKYFGESELDFYFVFHYLLLMMKADHISRYTLNSHGISLEVPEFDLSEELIGYLETLPDDDVVRCNELPFLYASQSRMEDCLRGLADFHEWSSERQMVFLMILEKYGTSFLQEMSRLDITDQGTLEKTAWLISSISRIRYPAAYEERIRELTDTLSAKCQELEDDPVRWTMQYSIMTCISDMAERAGLGRNNRCLREAASVYFEKMQGISLPQEASFMEDIFDKAKVHLQIMELLKKARKSLDENLPDELCDYILNSAEKLFRRLFRERDDRSSMNGLFIVPGIMSSLAMYHELCGDLWTRKNDREKALEHYIAAESLETVENNGSCVNHATFLVKIGKNLEDDGCLDEAMSFYRRAYGEYRQAIDSLDLTKDKSAVPLCVCRIAGILQKQGEYRKAYEYLKNACASFEKMYRETQSIQSTCDYAICLYKIGELAKEAAQWIEEGRSYVWKAACIMAQIAKNIQSDEWMENMVICVKLYQKLGGKLE